MHFIKAKTILSSKNGMNLYRGCTHGCIYCDSRSDCYQMDHSFEDIAVKQNAIELLQEALQKKRKPCMIGTGSMCDPYMHCEQDLQYTRRCLEIIDQYQCGATVITKSDRILRDIDLLETISRHSKAVVHMTLTTFDENLCRMIEPNVCGTKRCQKSHKKLKNCKNFIRNCHDYHWNHHCYSNHIIINNREKYMNEYRYCTLRELPKLKNIAAEWFHSKWGVPKEAYLDCMDHYLDHKTELGWYLKITKL